jgi:uncharacterized protein YukE
MNAIVAITSEYEGVSSMKKDVTTTRLRADTRFAIIEERMSNFSSSVEEIKDTLKELTDKIETNEESWQRALKAVGDSFDKRLESAVNMFTESTRHYVKRSEYQVLKGVLIAIFVAIAAELISHSFGF